MNPGERREHRLALLAGLNKAMGSLGQAIISIAEIVEAEDEELGERTLELRGHLRAAVDAAGDDSPEEFMQHMTAGLMTQVSGWMEERRPNEVIGWEYMLAGQALGVLAYLGQFDLAVRDVEVDVLTDEVVKDEEEAK